MKCQSVATLWSGSPLLHKVTATAAFDVPPTLYTGGSDGSIICWKLSGTESKQEVVPMAMFCGHAAPIAGLNVCFPTVGSGEIESSSNVNSISAASGALISACTDGVLCIWSRGSGHCKCRRKLPLWIGSPSMMSPLPMSRRYLCIGCTSAEAAERETIGQIQNGTTTDRETHHRKSPKCAVVIVDSCTLTIVRTVFHGNLSIGPLKFMVVVPSVEDTEKQSVIMADALGNLQAVAILKGSDLDGESGIDLHNSDPSHTGTFLLAGSSHDGVQPVSVTTNGNLLALIFRTHCIFKSVSNGSLMGEISLVDSSLSSEGISTQVYVVGGMFLRSDSSDELDVQFVLWSNTGAAIMYLGLRSGDAFKFEPICEIPAVSDPLDKRMLISFCQVNWYLLRIESICINVEGSLLWEPHIKVWSICNKKFGNLPTNIILEEGNFLGDLTWNSFSLYKTEACKWETEKNSSLITKSKFSCGENGDSLVLKGRIASSSMILSEDFYAPYAVVYGFYNGEVEVVRFEMFFQEPNFGNGSVDHGFDPHIPKLSFSGHTGPVLCLAAHHLVETSDERSLNRVLISGSMDCTIRIWDMDTGNLVSVMHHHVAPVRQIILPPPWTNRPWSDCFLSVGEDACVALASLGTLRVERMFPGHPSYPTMVAWDSARGYIACLCRSLPAVSGLVNVLYIWDLKTGARERVLRGAASHSMFDHFCKGININSITGNILGGTTSVSSLALPLIEDACFSQSQVKNPEKGKLPLSTFEAKVQRRIIDFSELTGAPVHNSKGKLPFANAAHDFSYDAADNSSVKQVPSQQALQNKDHPIKCSCPFPGIATLKFNLSHLMSPYQRHAPVSDQNPGKPNVLNSTSNDGSDAQGTTAHPTAAQAWTSSLEGRLLRFSLSFLHLWDVDLELDKLLINEMNVFKPDKFVVASGLQGDRGSLTLTFPGLQATLELWRSSSEFCAMRSLIMVSLAQRMISLSSSSSAASSALAAFYTRNFAEKVPDVKPPLLQLLVSFWQDPSEHVRMAARTLFHCAASRAIPLPLSGEKSIQHVHSSSLNEEGEDLLPNTGEESNSLDLYGVTEMRGGHLGEESSTIAWLESFEMQEWVSCIGGTRQDAMASHIIVAAALAVWYPILVKPSISKLVVHRLMKLVMATNERYSATAAELLAEGMESTWKSCIGPEILDLVRDIFFQIECVSGAPINTAVQNSDVGVTIRKTLVGILLPSLAMADVTGFLSAIESQIWATASDSPVHLVALMTLIRIIRASPKPLVPYLDKVVNFILQTMDHGNSVMRKSCLQSSMVALGEVVRVFPMVALNETSTRLAIGDAVGDIHSVTIRIYDMQSVTKIKVLDASGPPGLPNLLVGTSDTMINTAISALSFSPDGEGLVAFSEHGLMIRWWSVGTVWWEKLSRSMVPVQCTKLIFVPPWEGFSPNSSRASIMGSIIGHDNQILSLEKTKGLGDSDNLKLLIHNIDLSYRLAWIGERKVELTRHGHELGFFQL